MKARKALSSLTMLLVSSLFMTSCSSSDGGFGPSVSQLIGMWSISNVQDQYGNTSNMQFEFMSMSYAQYAPTIGQSASATIPAGALAYTKTTVTTTYNSYGGYPWGGSNSQYLVSKQYTKEVGYFTVSNATGTDKLRLYPQATLTSSDGLSWYNEGSSSVALTEYTYSVSGDQLTFYLPDLTSQVWTKGAGGGSTPVTNSIVGIWQISNMNQAGNSVNMQLELTSTTYAQYAPSINQQVPPGLPESALAYTKTTVTTYGGGYDPWGGSGYGTKTYAKEIGYYTTSNVSGANKLMLHSLVNMTSTDGVSWVLDTTSPSTISEYTYVLNGYQLIFNLPDLTQQIWTRMR